MLQPTSLFIGLRYTIAKRRSRSVSFISGIAMLGIILGVALLITVLSVMNGFDKELRERILAIMPQVSVYYSANNNEWPTIREHILRQERISAATPFVELQGMLHESGVTQPSIIYGIDQNYNSSVSKITDYLDDSTLIDLAENNTIALGVGLAQKLNVMVGGKITLIIPQLNKNNVRKIPVVRRLKIIDVFATGTELDHSLALMGIKGAAQLSSNPEGVTGLHIKVKNLFEANYIANNVQSSLRQELFINAYANDWTRTHGNIYSAIKTSKSLVSLLLFLIIAIAAFNVVSTLMMVVVDKQSDIAILRTLGVSDRQVITIFVVQGTIIGIVGTAIGVGLGILFALSVESFVAALESFLGFSFLQSAVYPVSFLPSSLQLNDVLLIAFASLIMSFIATIYPAIKASQVKPAEALRFED